MKKSYFSILFYMMLIFMVTSCDVPVDHEWYEREYESYASTNYSGNIKKLTEWFVESEAPENKKKFVLRTNDTKYLMPGGYTAHEITNASTVTNVSAEVSRQSGSTTAGYGIVFAARKKGAAAYMLSVMINTQKMYTVGKFAEGNYITIKDWTITDCLRSGYGKSNKISVSVASDKSITVSLNDVAVYTFKDTPYGSIPALYSGGHGYIVVIPEVENFPESFAEVTFIE